MKTFKTTLVMLCVFVLGYIFINQVDVSAEDTCEEQLTIMIEGDILTAVGESPNYDKYIKVYDSCNNDVTDIFGYHIVNYKIDLTKEGVYPALVSVYNDSIKEFINLSFEVEVKKDKTKPEISNYHQHYYFEIESDLSEADFLKGVTVIDDMDDNPQLSIDYESVDINSEGIYDITFTAEDKSGNIETVEVKVHVVKELPEYLEEDNINVEVSNVMPDLKQFITIDKFYREHATLEVAYGDFVYNKLGRNDVTVVITFFNIQKNILVNVNVIDSTKPKISGEKNIKLKKDSLFYWDKYFTVKDNYDRKENIDIEIEGHFDIKETGDYNLVLRATDSSGNIARYPFTLTIANKGSSFIVWTAIIVGVIAIGAGGTLIYFKKFKRD